MPTDESKPPLRLIRSPRRARRLGFYEQALQQDNHLEANQEFRPRSPTETHNKSRTLGNAIKSHPVSGGPIKTPLTHPHPDPYLMAMRMSQLFGKTLRQVPAEA